MDRARGNTGKIGRRLTLVPVLVEIGSSAPGLNRRAAPVGEAPLLASRLLGLSHDQIRLKAEGAPMDSIAGIVADLDSLPEEFSVEALCDVIKVEWIEEALRQTGRGSQRERRMPAPLALWLVVLLALFRRHSYTNLLHLLAESLWARRHWPERAPPSSSALTQARDRLGPEPVRRLFDRSSKAFLDEVPGLRLGGLRLMAMDGSTGRTPDCEANEAHFGRPGSSRGRSAYPMLRMVTLLDLGTRLTVDTRFGPYRTGEVTLARSLLEGVPMDALVVMDRNFAAYELLWDLHQGRGAHFVVRVKRNMKSRTVRRISRSERIVRIRIPRAVRRHRPDLPCTWDLREVTCRPRPGHEAIRLFTSMLDPTQVSAEEIAGAYGQRWGQETAFDETKTHLLGHSTVNQPVLFRSKTPRRVEQELYGVFLAHNVVRMLLFRAAPAAELSPLRLSFVVALERVREAVRDMAALPTARLPERYARLLAALTRVIVPTRPGRSNPREVKIKMSSYPCKQTRCVA